LRESEGRQGNNDVSGQEIAAEVGPPSAIALAYREGVTVRGFDLCSELIGRVGFTEYFLLLLSGRRPSRQLIQALDATLVAIAEHGLVPSVQAARMTYAAAPTALQGAVAAGILGCGEVILGAAEAAGEFLAGVDAAVRGGVDRDEAIKIQLAELKRNHQSLPGFGHPLHKPEDPRAWRLIEYAREIGVASTYVAILEATYAQAPSVYSRALPLNVSGAIAAVLLDAGFPLEALKGVPLVARVAGLIAHLMEERRRPIGFKLAEAGAASVRYDGERPTATRAG
jgi:citrate synthase